MYLVTLPINLDYAPYEFVIRFLAIALSFTAFVTFAPFMFNSEVNGFWQHNKNMVIRLFFTFIYMLALYLGLVLAFASIDLLFDADIYDELYFELWIFVAGIIATTFFLAGLEQKTEKLEKVANYPRGIKIFSQYILTPLLSIYSVIITAYFIKILITGEWPRGMIVYLIFVFSFAGILTYFMLYPLSNKAGSVWVKWFSRSIFALIIPFTGMLFWAIYLRINQYGVTEARYYVVVLGFWLFGIACYFLFSRKKDLRIIPLSLCLIALLSSFGSWGAVSVSERNQVKRLERVLISNNILISGKIQKAQGEISREDLEKISGIIDYLNSFHGYGAIQPWFNEELNEPEAEITGEFAIHRPYKTPQVMKIMGVEYIPEWKRGNDDYPMGRGRSYISFNSLKNVRDKPLSVKGYSYITNFGLRSGTPYQFKIDGDQYYLILNEGNNLILKKGGNEVNRINMNDMLKGLMEIAEKGEDGNIDREKMVIEKEGVKIYFYNIYIGDPQKESPEVSNLSGDLLIK